MFRPILKKHKGGHLWRTINDFDSSKGDGGVDSEWTYSLYSTLLCNLSLGIDIDLTELDILRFIGQLLENWFNHPTGTTPLCPEVNDYRLTRIDLWRWICASTSVNRWEAHDGLEFLNAVNRCDRHDCGFGWVRQSTYLFIYIYISRGLVSRSHVVTFCQWYNHCQYSKFSHPGL